MKILRSEAGFTLIELVLIIIILGILAATAVVQFSTMAASARDGAIDGAFGAVNSQLAIGIGLCRGFPVDATGAEADCDSATNDFSGNFETVVINRVILTGDLSVGETSQAGPYTFNICSGAAGNGRFALATYTDVPNPPTLTLAAKQNWGSGACTAAAP